MSEELIAAYRSGKTLQQVGREFGCSAVIVARRLEQAGIARRLRGARSQENEARLSQMVEMRAAGQELRDIGKRFGVSRERVRQLLAKRGIAGRVARPPVFPVRRFRSRMRAHLLGAGYGYCQPCRAWLCAAEFSPRMIGRLCRKCNALRVKLRYRSNPQVRQRMYEYRKENPERVRAILHRYRAKRQAKQA